MSIIKETTLNISDIDFYKLWDDWCNYLADNKADGFVISQFHYWLIKTKFYNKKFKSVGSSNGQKESDNAKEKFTESIVSVLEELGMLHAEDQFHAIRFKEKHTYFIQ